MKKIIFGMVFLILLINALENRKKLNAIELNGWFNGLDLEHEMIAREVYNYSKTSDKSLTAIVYRLDNKEAVCYINAINNSTSCFKK